MSGRKRNFRQALNSVLVIGLILLVPICFYISNFVHIFQLNQQIKELEVKIETTQEESNRLDDDLAQIGTQSYIEKLARKYLGLYYPNEKIVIPVPSQSEETATSETNQASDDTVKSEGEDG